MYYFQAVLVTTLDFWAKRAHEMVELRKYYKNLFERKNLMRIYIGNLNHMVLGTAYDIDSICYKLKRRDPSIMNSNWFNRLMQLDDGPWIVFGLIDEKLIPVAKQMPELFISAKHNPEERSGLSARPKLDIGLYGYHYVSFDGHTCKEKRDKDLLKNVVFIANQDNICYAVNLKYSHVVKLPEKEWANIKYDLLDKVDTYVYYESDTYSIRFTAYRDLIFKHHLRRTSAIELMGSFILNGVLLD